MAEGRENFALWKNEKRIQILQHQTKKAELCAELRDAAGAVYHSEEDELLTTAGDSIPDMQRIYQHIQELDQKITEEQSTVDRLDDQIENTDNDGVERLLQSLDLDKAGPISVHLGEHHVINLDILCYDVTAAPSGDLLVGTEQGLHILNASTHETINTLDVGGRVFSVDCNTSRIFIGVQVTRKIKTMILTLDADYKVTNSWTISRNSVDIAIIGEKICMTHGMYERIAQYDISTGSVEFELQCDSPPDGIAACLFNSYIVTNEDRNTVEKITPTKDGLERQWVLPGVIKPFAVTVDNQGVSWVRSNRNDQIIRISKEGKKLQEIEDDQITSLGKIYGVCVHDDTLWMAHCMGVASFKIHNSE